MAAWYDPFNYPDGSTLGATADWAEYDAVFNVYNPAGNNTGRVYTFGTGQARRVSGTGVDVIATSNIELFWTAPDYLRVGIIVGFLDATHYLMWEINVNDIPGENKIGLYLRHGTAVYDHLYEDLGMTFASGQVHELKLELNGLQVRAWLNGVLKVTTTLTSTQRGYLGNDVAMIGEKGVSAWYDFRTEHVNRPAVIATTWDGWTATADATVSDVATISSTWGGWTATAVGTVYDPPADLIPAHIASLWGGWSGVARARINPSSSPSLATAAPPTRWTFSVRNPNGDEFVLNPIGDVSLTWNFEGVTAEIDIPAYAAGLPVVTDLVSDILVERNDQLMFRMRVLYSEDEFTRESHTIRLTCASYEEILRKGRIMYESKVMSSGDQHSLAWDIVQTTQARQTLGITQFANTPSGVARSTTTKAGQSVAEAIDGVAAAGDGFDWWIDQYLAFHAQTPRREGLIDDEWAWGAEIAEIRRSSPAEQYMSAVYMAGATNETILPSGIVYPPPTPQLREISPMPYGRWERDFSDSDIVTVESLAKKADWYLGTGAEFRPNYSITLERGIWTPAIEIGTILAIRVQADARMSFKVPVRIEEIQIDISSSSGAEDVSMMLKAESPELDLDDSLPPAVITDANNPPVGAIVVAPPPPSGLTKTLIRISPVQSLGSMIQTLADRISRQERAT